MNYAKNQGANKMDYGVQGIINGDLKANTFYVRSHKLYGTTYNYAYNVGDMLETFNAITAFDKRNLGGHFSKAFA